MAFQNRPAAYDAPFYVKGFTLIELLVVLSILAVAAGLTLPALRLTPVNDNANTLKTLQNTLAPYRKSAITDATRYTVHITGAGKINVLKGTPYTQSTCTEDKASPVVTHTLPASVQVVSLRGEKADHSLIFYPNGASSVMHFIKEDQALSYTGAAVSAHILPYTAVKP